MNIVSVKKRFPVVGVVIIFSCLMLIVLGLYEVLSGKLMGWLHMALGGLMIPNWTHNICSQVVAISLNDEEIRFQKRRGEDSVVLWDKVFYSDLRRRGIRVFFQGDVSMAHVDIPFTMFDQVGREALISLTETKQAEQVAAPDG
ncbi:hypothetical protein HW115_19150 [Verrucomicrobiaceae bacterium N1E253]|uniref:YcxB-like protein domain-containing protein n=1 Tax=Oceaniferula marina TaxID=2748318 RepID=A0A851GTV0_9BACT|nr:hypothetical protein [Oceaniferula marina]NWK57744.1 hypothetical protein [Oceaniferula marina]